MHDMSCTAQVSAVHCVCEFRFITVRNEVAKVMFLQAFVCPQGGYLTRYLTRYTPWDQVHPLGPGTWEGKTYTTRYTPRTRYTPWYQVHHPTP